MRKPFIAAIALLLTANYISAQTLFTYGGDTVTTAEFLKAYRKNNTSAKSNPQELQEYLELYIASRLKIKEAKQRGLEKSPQIVADLENLRAQILPAYLNDEESINKLVEEAFVRSQKDIRLAHIFIAFKKDDIVDTVAANKKYAEALKKLNAGENFNSVAKAFSDDPSVKTNGGNIGFVTVFTLPYELENLAYKTKIGKYATHRSKAGYHIIKNVGERKAAGRLKASQILIAFPPEADATTKASAKKLADSLYYRLLKGDDFEKLVVNFSNDIISAASKGQMQEFGVGEYNLNFEANAFAIKKDGAFTKPFLTEHGWHIVKRHSLSHAKKEKKEDMLALRERVEQSDRMATTKDALIQKILKRTNFKKTSFSNTDLWSFTDASLNNKFSEDLKKESVLFSLADEKVTAGDWLDYAQVHRFKSDGTGLKSYDQLWNEFVAYKALELYQENLESFNPDFKAQIEEFSEGNLFFEIMQQQVWGPAQNDSVALEHYFNQHKSSYTWKKSADAIIFYSSDLATANAFYKELQSAPKNWRDLLDEYNDKVAADSGRVELTQLPNAWKDSPKAGTITSPSGNNNDQTASFAYIVKIYEQPAHKTFAEARGAVINDYQTELERKWIAELKTKYPVQINEAELKSLLK